MQTITSRNNPLIVETAKLKMKKYRDLKKSFIVEGKKLFGEALSAGMLPSCVFVCEDSAECFDFPFEKFNTVSVTREVYEKLTAEKSPQGILGVFPYGENIISIDNNEENSENFNNVKKVFKSVTNGYIIIENMQDSGNVGTVIRTALAFGIDAVICVSSAEVYNPKTMRAAMGALFRMKTVLCSDIVQAAEIVREGCKKIYAAALHNDSISIDEADFSVPCAVMIGNEGNGLTEKALEICDKSVIIPISVNSESLNAGVAAAIFMDHMRRG